VNRVGERIPYMHHDAHDLHLVGYSSYKTVGKTLQRVGMALRWRHERILISLCLLNRSDRLNNEYMTVLQ
jgi:hypothetical protein